MNATAIASQIRIKMSEGVGQLKRSAAMRMEIDDIIRRNHLLPETRSGPMNEQQLMTQLVKALFTAWPVPLALPYEEIRDELTSFADIVAILNDPALNKSVAIAPACVLRDSRIPPEDFKRDVFRLLFAEPGAETDVSTAKLPRQPPPAQH